MSTVLGKPQITPDELLELPDDARFELVDGQLVRKEMSLLAAWVASRINKRLGIVVEPQELGVVLTSDASYRCFGDDPDRIRRPDISFIQRARMRPEYVKGHIPIAPDLAVEVVSPNDLFFDVRRKAGEFERAGTRLVWVVNPDKREIEIFRSDGSHSFLRGDEYLEGENVVPGFRCPLTEIFQSPPMG
ncbi:MAG TPA: Uma2 family endonuclease [Pirellulales bacterium]|jgi:Uma2 family endonuclease